METVFNIYFIICFFLDLLISENKFFYVLSTNSIVEYIAVIPSFLADVGAIKRDDYINFTRVLRLALVHKFDKILARHSKEVARHYFKLFNSMLRILIITASILLVVEKDENDYTILDWLYFMVVTVASVGFGDVAPKTVIGRVRGM